MKGQTRDRRTLIAAVGLSSFGDELAVVALALRVEALSGSVTAVALLFVAAALPHVLLAPVSGWLTDRRETVGTLRWCSIAQAFVATGLAFAGDLPVVFVLAFVLGALASVTGPSVFALVPLLGGDKVSKTNSSLEIAKYAGWITGPFVAGAVASRQGTAAPLLIDALTFAALAGMTLRLTIRRPPIPAETPVDEGGARAGFIYILRARLLLLVFVVMGGIVLFAATDNVAEVFFAKDTLGQPAIGYGILASAWLAGMVLGALVARHIVVERAATWIFGSAVVGGIAVFAAAVSGALIPAAALFAVGGITNGIENVGARSLIHARVPTALHGRVFAAFMGLVSGTQIVATMLGGVLVGAVGGQQALIIGGIGATAIGLLGLLILAMIHLADPRVVSEKPVA